MNPCASMNIGQKKRMYFYELNAEKFDSKMNMYDTNKRIEIIFSELLHEDIKGKKLLDAGCGTGWISKAACERKAIVISMDLGVKLLTQTARKCDSIRVAGSILNMPFPDNTFDVIISSEVIEHTPHPFAGVEKMYRTLKPGGILILTTPNKIWYFSVWIANKLKLRHYQGIENWTSWREAKKRLDYIGFKREIMIGLYILPFVHPIIYPLLDFFNRFKKKLGPIMINIVIRCRK